MNLAIPDFILRGVAGKQSSQPNKRKNLSLTLIKAIEALLFGLSVLACEPWCISRKRFITLWNNLSLQEESAVNQEQPDCSSWLEKKVTKNEEGNPDIGPTTPTKKFDLKNRNFHTFSGGHYSCLQNRRQ